MSRVRWLLGETNHLKILVERTVNKVLNFRSIGCAIPLIQIRIDIYCYTSFNEISFRILLCCHLIRLGLRLHAITCSSAVNGRGSNSHSPVAKVWRMLAWVMSVKKFSLTKQFVFNYINRIRIKKNWETPLKIAWENMVSWYVNKNF